MNYARDVSIDYNNLHFEWARQPDLTLQYGEELAEARRLTDKAKEALDVAKAKAFQKALAEVQKPVDAVKAAADLDPDFLNAVESYNMAQHNQRLVQVAYDAVQVKKTALENWVRLHGQEYFAQPIEPREYEQWAGKRFGEESQEKVKDRANANAKAAAAARRPRTK